MGSLSGIQNDFTSSTRHWSGGYSEGTREGLRFAIRYCEDAGKEWIAGAQRLESQLMDPPEDWDVEVIDPGKIESARDKYNYQHGRSAGYSEALLSAAKFLGRGLGEALFEKVMDEHPKAASIGVVSQVQAALGITG